MSEESIYYPNKDGTFRKPPKTDRIDRMTRGIVITFGDSCGCAPAVRCSPQNTRKSKRNI